MRAGARNRVGALVFYSKGRVSFERCAEPHLDGSRCDCAAAAAPNPTKIDRSVVIALLPRPRRLPKRIYKCFFIVFRRRLALHNHFFAGVEVIHLAIPVRPH